MATTIDAVTQTITAATAHVAKNRDAFSTQGQRALFLVEELVKGGLLGKAASSNEASVIGAALGAHAALEVKKAKDIRYAILLVRASLAGEAGAKEIVERLRAGKHLSSDAAYCYWKRGEKEARGEKPTKRRLKPKSFMPRSMKLTAKDRAWLIAKAREIKKAKRTSGQKSIAMNKALVERGLAHPKKQGGPAAGVAIRKLLATTLGINRHELGLGMTILRREASGSLTPGAIEALESGRYESCGHVVDKFTGPRRRSYIEEIKSGAWLKSEALRIASNVALLTPSMRAIAFLESMVKKKVLDPIVRVSTQAVAVHEIAVKHLPGVVYGESESCWAMLRAIARKELPAHAIEPVRRGSTTAATLTSSHGGIAGLAKAINDGVKVEVEADPMPVETVDLRVATPMDDLVVTEADEIGDPVAAIHDLASEVGTRLDEIITVGESKEDRELVTFAKRFRDHIGLYKMQASKLRNRRSAGKTRRSK